LSLTSTKGYISSLNKDDLIKFTQDFNKTSLTLGLIYIIFYHLSIFVILFIYYKLLSYNYFYLGLLPLVLLFLARQLRSLENTVHFGSHYNLTKNKKLNDAIINIFCAFPVMQKVSSYRTFHLRHHSRYGSDIDPCKIRFDKFIEQDKKNILMYLNFIIKNLPSYFIEYYKELGSKLQNISIYFLYNLTFFTLLSIFFNTDFAIFSCLLMNISMFVLLPVIRSIAEYDEHNYKKSNNLFETTFNNLSLTDFLFFHPAGDGYHIIHHLFPAIPWWKQRAAHHYLLKNDNSYLQACNRTKFHHKYTLI